MAAIARFAVLFCTARRVTAAGGRGSRRRVRLLRRLIRSHVRLAALVCAAALALRLLVPAGYMVSGEGGRIAVTLCPGTAPVPAATMTAMHHAMPGHDAPKQDHADAPCAFAGLAVPTLGAVDPVMLAVALAIVAALALRPARAWRRRDAPHLRPPLRGPPLPG
jgi:hypothetical protein